MQSHELVEAKKEFDRINPDKYQTKFAKELYCWIIIPHWPSEDIPLKDIHYEFRYSNKEGLFVECHIENERYVYAGKIFKELADTIKVVNGIQLEFFENRKYPNLRKRPSLSIRLGHNVSGVNSAKTMIELIEKTKTQMSNHLY
jgi:hypothetical protein